MLDYKFPDKPTVSAMISNNVLELVEKEKTIFPVWKYFKLLREKIFKKVVFGLACCSSCHTLIVYNQYDKVK